MTPDPHPADPVRYGSRYGSPAASDPDTLASTATDRRCPVCQTTTVPARARYCSDACRQRAYRLRRRDPAPADLTTLAATLRRQRALRSAQIYECGGCGERRLGEPRCPDCHRFARAIGLGGLCPHCDEPILLADLFPPEVLP
jgi:predicted nucleic acid-binding Zn ribbon protein